MRAIIAGATGLVGQKLVQALIEDSRISKILVLTRREVPIDSSKVEPILITDLKELPKLQDKFEAELFFCCLGTTIKKAGSADRFREVDETAVWEFSKLATKNPTSTFVLVSAQGANENSRFLYPQVKGRVERMVGELNISRTIIFRPSLLIGHRAETRFLENVGIKAYRGLSPVLPKSWRRSIGTEVEVLVRMMIKKALERGPLVEVIESRDICD
jgi:uncharacterized protein YbjT (DUF2867 family)